MPTEPIPFARRKAAAPSPVKEVHIVWLTAGLSCDGDSVSVTAAEQPSIEDVILGAIPGLAEGAPAQSCARLRESATTS